MDEYITRAEHTEFCARLDAENNRQNRRIEILEGTTKQISELVTSVQKLAMSVESMVKEQSRQGERLETLENRDGEMWRKVSKHHRSRLSLKTAMSMQKKSAKTVLQNSTAAADVRQTPGISTNPSTMHMISDANCSGSVSNARS